MPYREPKRILYADPFDDPDEDASVQFRLTYAGRLLSTQRDPPEGVTYREERRDYRHCIRRTFHKQLSGLWENTPRLKLGKEPGLETWNLQHGGAPEPRDLSLAALTAQANRDKMFGFAFVPLVTPDMHLLVGLDILFLRRDPPGSMFSQKQSAGDIDNRIKTLIDCLRVPDVADGYGGTAEMKAIKPADGENPFFCLLQNDSLITKVAVETDALLEDVSEPPDNADARLIITVKLTPSRISWHNLAFVG